MAAKRSSQYGMLWMIPFDLVADVTWRRRPLHRQLERVAHDAVAARRVKTDCWTASSSGVPR